jgi:hypothetical protein
MGDVESLWHELRINKTRRFAPNKWQTAFVVFKELLEVPDTPDITMQIGRLRVSYDSAYDKFFLSGRAPPIYAPLATYGGSLCVVTIPARKAQFLRGILVFTHDSFRKQWDIHFDNAILRLVKTSHNELSVVVKRIARL